MPYTNPGAAQYVEQFLPLPLDAMRGVLEQAQQRYDENLTRAMTFAGEAAATPFLNLEDKQYVMSGVQADMDAIEQKYQGDWGRAGEDLMKTAVKWNQDPIWYLNELKRKGFETEQQLKAQYGINAYTAGSVADVKLRNMNPETGKWEYAQPTALTPRVYNLADVYSTIRGLVGEITPKQETKVIRGNTIDPSIPANVLFQKTISEVTPEMIENHIDSKMPVLRSFAEANPDYKILMVSLGNGDYELGLRTAAIASYEKAQSRKESGIEELYEPKVVNTTPTDKTGNYRFGFVDENNITYSANPIQTQLYESGAGDVEYRVGPDKGGGTGKGWARRAFDYVFRPDRGEFVYDVGYSFRDTEGNYHMVPKEEVSFMYDDTPRKGELGPKLQDVITKHYAARGIIPDENGITVDRKDFVEKREEVTKKAKEAVSATQGYLDRGSLPPEVDDVSKAANALNIAEDNLKQVSYIMYPPTRHDAEQERLTKVHKEDVVNNLQHYTVYALDPYDENKALREQTGEYSELFDKLRISEKSYPNFTDMSFRKSLKFAGVIKGMNRYGIEPMVFYGEGPDGKQVQMVVSQQYSDPIVSEIYDLLFNPEARQTGTKVIKPSHIAPSTYLDVKMTVDEVDAPGNYVYNIMVDVKDDNGKVVEVLLPDMQGNKKPTKLMNITFADYMAVVDYLKRGQE